MISFALSVKPRLIQNVQLFLSLMKWRILLLVNQSTLLDSNKNESPFVICENGKKMH